MDLKQRLIKWITVLGMAGLMVSSASAQQAQQQFAIDRFEPSARGSEWFAMDSLDLRGAFRPSIGVVGSYAYRPLAVYDRNSDVTQSIIRNQLVLHAGASVVFADRFRLSLNVPIQVMNQPGDGLNAGQSVNINNAYSVSTAANSASVGDIRIGADIRLLGEYGTPFTLAIGGDVWVPTGKRADWTGDENVRGDGHLLLAGRIGIFEYAGRAGYMYRKKFAFANQTIGSELFYGAAIGLRLANEKLLIGPELYGSTNLDSAVAPSEVGGPFKALTTPLEGIIGAHYTIGDDWRIGAAVGRGFYSPAKDDNGDKLGSPIGSPQLRVLASLEYVPGIEKPAAVEDRDHDGIPDTEDACPDAPGVRTADAATNGCPAVGDRDGDGIADDQDACPDMAGLKTDDPRTNGCPADRDNDGVYDTEDACPDTAGVRTNDPNTNGCPGDRDGDTVPDNEDACPDVPGLKTTDAKTNGCPDPDRDHDGVLNEQDACPDEAGKEDADPKKNGCPKAFIKDGQIRILDQVKFKTGSAKIDMKDAATKETLEAVYGIMAAHPEIARIRVEGHTDNKGKAAKNKKLSDARAKSVVKDLVKRGIAKDRLVGVGYGDERPIDTNDTDVGRANNRRVEFHIEEQAQQQK